MTALLFPASRDFETWTNLGNEGWSARDIAPYYRKSMRYHQPSDETNKLMALDSYMKPELYGTDGPIQASFAEGFGPFDTAFVAALDDMGLSKKSDPSLGRFRGVVTPLTTVDSKTGKRSYAASAYWEGLAEKREHVDLITETLVNRLVLEKSSTGVVEAKGVEVRSKDGQSRTISCRQVILAAGALQTPVILERSGIGARKLLEQHNIPVVVDNPGVGENLQDHVFAPISFEVADGIPTRDAVRDPAVVEAMVKEYAASHSGPLASVPLQYGFLPLVDGAGRLGEEDLKKLVAGLDEQGAQASQLRSLMLDPEQCTLYYALLAGQQNIFPSGRTTMQEAHAPLRPENYATIAAGLSRPLSRGSVHLAGADPALSPVIDPRYLTNPADLEMLARGVQFIVGGIIEQPSVKRLLKPGGIRLPGYATDDSILSRDLDAARRVVRERLWSNYHVACSCPMMPKKLGGVVDDRLVVYGTSNVRVVDASVHPLITQGNIQATVYAVAERACDLIKEDWARL